MREVGVLEAKTKLSALLDEVEREGHDVLITRHGKPVARLTRATEPLRRKSEFADMVLQVRERIAAQWQGDEPFDWKAAVEEGRK